MDKASVTVKNKRYSALAWILAILVLAVAVPLNLIFERLNINFDMTPNNLYTLTDTTKKYLDELDAKGITVDVYFLEKLDALEGDLECLALYRTLVAYKEHPCFNLIDFDPDTDPESLRKINPDGIYNLSSGDFLFKYNDMVKRLPGTLMYTYQTDADDRVVSAEFRAENYFTGYMKTVVDGVLPTVYFLSGHDEVPLSDMSQLCANLGNYNYGAKELNLMTDTDIPDDCCILVIASPKKDLTEEEYKKILSYTQKGGHISVLMSPNDSDTVYQHIEMLLSNYCIGMNYDRVEETDANRHSHNETYAMMCDILQANSETGEDLTSALLPNVNNIVTFMPYSRSFYTIYGTNFGKLTADTLIQTQTTAKSVPYGGKLLDPQTVEGQPQVLSMYVIDTEHENSKLVVFGSSDFITDKGAGNAYFINPLQLFLTTVTWMYNSDVDMNIQDKARSFDSLTVNSSGEASGLIAMFVGFPILIAAVGVIIWLRRKDA